MISLHALIITLLDELERDGFVTRELDPADRRARIVRLTSTGRARHAAARADIRTMEAQLLAELGAAERRTLLTVLAQLAAGDR